MGLQGQPAGLRCGYQKFHGFEIELAAAGLARSAAGFDGRNGRANRDGFRFLYVLPLSPRRVLIEDTHFSDNRELDREQRFAELKRYLPDRQIRDWKIVREERGCLPMPYSKHMKPTLTTPLTRWLCGRLVSCRNRLLVSPGRQIR